MERLYLQVMGGTLEKSGQFIDSVDVEYHFVADPVTGEHVSPGTLRLLDQLGISYKVWGPEFWRY